MTYIPTQPEDQPPPNIAVDQIRENFLQYFNIFDNNHVALNAANQGKHSNVLLQRQTLDPDVEDNFDSLYGKSVNTASGTSDQAFVKIPEFISNVPNAPMQLTFNKVNLNAQYQSFLPGGYIIYWDSIPSSNLINTQITLVPAPSEILCVIPNPTKVEGTGLNPARPTPISVTLNNNFQFTIKAGFPTGTGVINWIAIARQ